MPAPGPAPRTGLAGTASRRGGPDADGARRTARPPAGPPPRAGRGRGPCAGCPPPSRTGAGHGSSRRSGGRGAPFGGTTGRPGGPARERAPRAAPRRSRREGERRPERRTRRTRGARGATGGVRRTAARRLRARPGPWHGPRVTPARSAAAGSGSVGPERVPVRGRGRLPARGTRGAIGRGEGWPAALGRPSPPVACADDGTSEAPPWRPGGEEPSRGRRAHPPLPRRTGVRHRRGPLPHPSGIDRAHRSPIVAETIWKRVRKLLYREHVRRVPSSRDRREPPPHRVRTRLRGRTVRGPRDRPRPSTGSSATVHGIVGDRARDRPDSAHGPLGGGHLVRARTGGPDSAPPDPRDPTCPTPSRRPGEGPAVHNSS